MFASHALRAQAGVEVQGEELIRPTHPGVRSELERSRLHAPGLLEAALFDQRRSEAQRRRGGFGLFGDQALEQTRGVGGPPQAQGGGAEAPERTSVARARGEAALPLHGIRREVAAFGEPSLEDLQRRSVAAFERVQEARKGARSVTSAPEQERELAVGSGAATRCESRLEAADRRGKA